MQIKSLLFLLFFVLHGGWQLGSLHAQSRQGKDRALFFAVNTYDNMTILRNPIQNARDIAKELEDNYGFLTEVVPNPSLSTVVKKIAAYKADYQIGKYKNDGQLLIFFTGHGIKKGKNGYFMPKDAIPNQPFSSAIEYDYWRDEINQIDCQHILVVIDACHSITFDPKWESKFDRNFSRKGEQYVDKVLLNHKAYRARLFFTSDAEGNETPDRSTFAKQFLEGLRTFESNTNYLTSSLLFAKHLKNATPTPGGGDFGDNEAASSFLFFKNMDDNSSNAYSDHNDWQIARSKNTLTAYNNYLKQNPNGDFQPLAQQMINQFRQEERELKDWEYAKRSNTRKGFKVFISKYPESFYVDLAKLKMRELPPAHSDNFILIKGGTFEMGRNQIENTKPVHSINISDFYISPNQVTVSDFYYFATDGKGYLTDARKSEKTFTTIDGVIFRIEHETWATDSYHEELQDNKSPVKRLSWNDAIHYCNWLSNVRRLEPVYRVIDSIVVADFSANGYRLPTEAEWEYAARCSVENNLGSKTSSNKIDLQNMIGGLKEWCWNWYDADYYIVSPEDDPHGPIKGINRVIRGAYQSITSRKFYPSNYYSHDLGFRLVRSVE